MKRGFTMRVFALLLALTLVPMFSDGAFANHSNGNGNNNGASNSVTLTIRGGDARALAFCLNLAKRGYDIEQVNRCDNLADAKGGDVTLYDVSVSIAQGPAPRNAVNLTIRGGDATALAACANLAGSGGSIAQANECINTAVATGGNVELDNVDIVVVQGPRA